MVDEKIVNTNCELLFIYDAKNTNPNGDPDNENRPRVDPTAAKNIVTDVRLKRYIRDYFERIKHMDIYVTNPDGYVLNAGDRLKYWKWKKNNAQVKNPDLQAIRNENLNDISLKDILNEFIDIRLFGATIPIKGEESGGGSSIAITGPVQFNWGVSLNEVEFVDTSSITSHFSSKEQQQGAIGKDYRLYYSLIAFHGRINAHRATETKLTWNDLTLLDEALIKSIPLLATRSKIGQYPRVYLRIVLNRDDVAFGDLSQYVTLKETKNLRDISDVQLDFSLLFEFIQENKDLINAIYYWVDDTLADHFNENALPLKDIWKPIEM